MYDLSLKRIPSYGGNRWNGKPRKFSDRRQANAGICATDPDSKGKVVVSGLSKGVRNGA